MARMVGFTVPVTVRFEATAEMAEVLSDWSEPVQVRLTRDPDNDRYSLQLRSLAAGCPDSSLLAFGTHLLEDE